MKYLPLFILFFCTCCSTGRKIILYNTEVDSGTGICFYTAKHNKATYYTEYHNTRVVELIEPTFKTESISYDSSQLIKYRTEEGDYRIPVAISYIKIILKDKEESSILKNYVDGFMLCPVEVPTTFETFTKEDLVKTNFVLTTRVLASPALLKYREIIHKPKVIRANELYLEEGHYNILCKAIAGGESHGAYTMFKVKQKLMELGYDLKDDDWRLNATYRALIDFQEKNNINVRVLDKKTEDALELF